MKMTFLSYKLAFFINMMTKSEAFCLVAHGELRQALEGMANPLYESKERVLSNDELKLIWLFWQFSRSETQDHRGTRATEEIDKKNDNISLELLKLINKGVGVSS